MGVGGKVCSGGLTLNAADIKAYDSVSGADVTDKFDITVNNAWVIFCIRTSV